MLAFEVVLLGSDRPNRSSVATVRSRQPIFREGALRTPGRYRFPGRAGGLGERSLAPSRKEPFARKGAVGAESQPGEFEFDAARHSRGGIRRPSCALSAFIRCTPQEAAERRGILRTVLRSWSLTRIQPERAKPPCHRCRRISSPAASSAPDRASLMFRHCSPAVSRASNPSNRTSK